MFGVYRFILAVNVVIYHVLDVASIGPYAVYSFFVLSGFLMTMIMNESYGHSLGGFKRYALNRFLRLYPVYWCLLLLGGCIILLLGNDISSAFHSKMVLPNEMSSTLANITMLYPAFEPVTYPVRILPASWALSIEILFYVLIGLGISRTRMMTSIWLFASICWVGGNMFQTGSFSTGYGNVLQAALPFSLGAWVYHYRKWVASVVNKIGVPLIICVYIGNIAIVVLCQILIADKAWFVSLIGSWVNLGLSTLMTVLLFEQGARFFSKTVDRVLGDLSYPIYLFHWSGAALASWLITEDMSKGALVFTLGLFITVIISVLVNKYVNESIERIRGRIRQG